MKRRRVRNERFGVMIDEEREKKVAITWNSISTIVCVVNKTRAPVVIMSFINHFGRKKGKEWSRENNMGEKVEKGERRKREHQEMKRSSLIQSLLFF